MDRSGAVFRFPYVYIYIHYRKSQKTVHSLTARGYKTTADRAALAGVHTYCLWNKFMHCICPQKNELAPYVLYVERNGRRTWTTYLLHRTSTPNPSSQKSPVIASPIRHVNPTTGSFE